MIIEEAHNPNKQVNTPPTQQPLSASPLLVLLLPSRLFHVSAFGLSPVLTLVHVLAPQDLRNLLPTLLEKVHLAVTFVMFCCASYVLQSCAHQYLIS